MVTITHDELAELLGVPASTSSAKLKRLMDAKFAEIDAEKRIRAEQRHARKDARLVEAAIADGRLTEGSRERWVNALAEDRTNNRTLLASLAPGLPPDVRLQQAGRSAPDPLEDIHDQVLASFGIVRRNGGQVAAAAAAAQPNWSAAADVGTASSPGFRGWVGKPREQWTDREVSDDMMRQLGPAFQAAVPRRAPGREFTYMDSPTALYKIDPATGRFVERTHQERQAMAIRGYQR